MKNYVVMTLAAMMVSAACASAMPRPVTIEDQGSFMAGGRTVTAAGTYDGGQPTDFAGHTLHGDHAYVFWQKPVKAKKYGMVFLHGYGQSAKTWETTPDGRDGFQNIFLSRGYATYLVSCLVHIHNNCPICGHLRRHRQSP